MTHIIIDRTVENKNKSSANRSKFIRRASSKIKEAVKDFIANDADIKSISNGKSKKIKINAKTLREPQIAHDRGRDRKQVVIGNKEFEAGDTVEKPQEEDDAPTAGDSGDGEDDFYFTLTHKEFLDIFFDDLELPDLIKKQLSDDEHAVHQAGYTATGSPIRLDLRKTLINSFKRSAAIAGSIDIDLEELQLKYENAETDEEKEKYSLEIEELLKRKDVIPFLEELDLRYRNIEITPMPVAKAVMICILDVSGSMTDWHKEIAKRFFMILYLFLTKQYDNVELVFIKHHHEAYEVDENDFFYSRLTGGTIVSQAILLAAKVLRKRYPTNLYNAYICQISDGDNMTYAGENETLHDAVVDVLGLVQYFAFVDVKDRMFKLMNEADTTLMKQYKIIKSLNSGFDHKFTLRSILDIQDIYLVFRSLFEKRSIH